ncbi:Hypothetical protein, putative [Bodo saltans]|uniref:Uncharacterized protein n=1 Tax=Bodo saltans TaxID=75058 RepID=A0A0S4KLQ3_BODSA|nr:Hypothetical protein, putative [Bodo saltans]|eukprot:CUI14513.1 Hypothetical protein, putative [Bodo saltans]
MLQEGRFNRAQLMGDGTSSSIPYDEPYEDTDRDDNDNEEEGEEGYLSAEDLDSDSRRNSSIMEGSVRAPIQPQPPSSTSNGNGGGQHHPHHLTNGPSDGPFRFRGLTVPTSTCSQIHQGSDGDDDDEARKGSLSQTTAPSAFPAHGAPSESNSSNHQSIVKGKVKTIVDARGSGSD